MVCGLFFKEFEMCQICFHVLYGQQAGKVWETLLWIQYTRGSQHGVHIPLGVHEPL
jgi:hypothetical protein